VLVTAGMLVPGAVVQTGAAAILLAWAVYHWRFGHRHRVRVGMKTGLLGLAAWSFVMATAHGAGLMLWPALSPSCLPGGAAAAGLSGPVTAAAAGVAIHTTAMLATTAVLATLVYEWVGVAVLRRAWLNVDLIWTLALAATAAALLLVR